MDRETWSPVRHSTQGHGAGGRGRERMGRKRRSSGEELTQPAYASRPPLSSSMFSFSQPGEPEMRTTHSLAQVDHAPYHTHQWTNRRDKVKRVEKDAMTGEHRHFRGPSVSFSPNHPSHRHSTHHHHGNVELIGHQQLSTSRSHGYGMECGNGTVVRGQIPCSRIGMGPADGSSSQVGMDEGPVDWEVRNNSVSSQILVTSVVLGLALEFPDPLAWGWGMTHCSPILWLGGGA